MISKKIAMIVGTIVAIGALGGATYWYLQGAKEREVKQLADNYFEALEKGSYEKMIVSFNPTSIKNSGYTKEEVLDKYQLIFSALHTDNVKVSDVKIEKNKEEYTISYTVSFDTFLGKLEDVAYQTTVEFVDKQPVIDWAPSLIFPQMEGKDRINIQEDPAERGEIVDRNGEKLATNRDYQQLGLNPSKLGDGEEKEQRLQAISETFSVSVDQLNERLSPEWATGDVFVPVKILYGNEESNPLKDLPEGAVIGHVNKRYYPLKEAAAHLIGYVSQVTKEDIEKDATLDETAVIGKAGLEATFDKQLRGESGGQIEILTEEGEVKEVLLEKERKNAEPLKLTLDAKVQETAFKNLDNAPGSTVIMQPQTGDLLATVSSPSYDPNKMMLGMTQKEYDAYANDEKLPFMTRFTNRYAPGSTFKVITGAIGLDEGIIKPEEELAISGLKWQKDQSWGSYEVTRVKEASPINLAKALVYSDNIYFAQKTLELGEDKFREGLSRFIFDEELDLPFYMEPASLSNEKTFSTDILLADTGYGQGELLISPIQQAAMYSVFMNDGQLTYPRLMDYQKAEVKENVISKESATTILADLVHSVSDEEGYVHQFYNPDFVLAAKTGTAEIKEKQDTTGIENSFLLYFDTENKQFMGITMVEDSRENGTAIEHSNDLVKYLEQEE